MQLDARQIASAGTMELYLTVTPDLGADPAGEARKMFAAIRQEAARCQGRICRERVFVPGSDLAAYQKAFQLEHGAAAAEIPLSWLMAGPGAPGGVQAHIIAGPAEWRPLLESDGRTGGWTWQNGSRRWAVTRGLCQPRTGDDLAATQQALESAEMLLRQAGLGLGDVARTWFYLRDILDWYGPFNATRNRAFRRMGLMGPNGDGRIPASTGIEGRNARGGWCALDVLALAPRRGHKLEIRRLSNSKQNEATEYGSAFARATEVVLGDARYVFVSGTASIDGHGETVHVGDFETQTLFTLEAVQALLAGAGASLADVKQATAFLKNPCDGRAFQRIVERSGLGAVPLVTTVADVCRDDLLFEIDATAVVPAHEGRR
jgi:enamine deaminase RidA (YjgF/YER057c/UK114 family)